MKLATLPILIVIALLGIFFYTWYRFHLKLNFHAPASTRPLPTGWNAEIQYVENENGQKIAFWYFPVEDSKATIILIHGYNTVGGKSQMTHHAEYLHNAGYSTVLVDLRAYGESDGEKMTLSVEEWQDVEAVYDHIKSLPESQSQTIGFFGVSMGASTVINAAGRTGKGDFVIASVPFANFDSAFKSQLKATGFSPTLFYPFLKLAALLELGTGYAEFTPDKVIQNINVPILLISAKHDEDVNGQDAVDLYDLANEPKELWVPDSGHDIYKVYPEEFEKRVLGFLDAHVEKIVR